MAPRGLRVIVHADDLGLSEAVNEAIVVSMARGWCSSTSLLANGPAFAHAVEALRTLREPDVGVHLNLTEFQPIRPDVLRSLFAGGALGPGALEATPAHEQAIVEEWTAQVAAVRAAGIEPSHLDSHQHLHWRPLFQRVLRQVAAATGIHRVRTMGAWRPEVGLVRGLLQRSRAARFTASLRRGDPPLVTTDHFANASTFRHKLEAGDLPGGTLEVMAHPGNPAHGRYADELRWLSGPWRPFGVELISWRQLS